MGLGIGVHCECCGHQLYYGTDDQEISKYTYLDAEGSQHIKSHPVLCADCHKAARFFMARWFEVKER